MNYKFKNKLITVILCIIVAVIMFFIIKGLFNDNDKKNENGKMSVARYAVVTFPEGTYEDLVLSAEYTEDCIVFGKVVECVSDEKGCRIR